MEKDEVVIPGIGTSVSVASIREFIHEHPQWPRSRLSCELCDIWGWYGSNGRRKDMACRDLLLKLENAAHITLPPRRRPSPNGFRNRQMKLVFHDTSEISCPLKALLPLRIDPVSKGTDDDIFRCLVSCYHYLGYRNTVGENMKYLIRDAGNRPVACLLFGSAAWKAAPRDACIGWSDEVRVMNLMYVTNNTRFLILPWVKVPHLASHILSQVMRRLRADWEGKYGHGVSLVETFVDTSRYRGTCYQAANWRYLGRTKGRSRNDRDHSMEVPVKDIYAYPVDKRFRERLCHGR